MLQKIRRKAAGFILGDDIVLFAPQRYIDMLQLNDYSAMPDRLLAETTRRFFSILGEVYAADAKKRSVPFSVFLTQCATLALAKQAHDVNAETATYHINGSVDGGRTLEDYHIEVKRKPHDPADWNDSDPPVEKVEEDGKITSLTYRISTRDQFDRWRMDRAASADRSPEGEKPQALNAKHESAVPEGQTPNLSHSEGE